MIAFGGSVSDAAERAGLFDVLVPIADGIPLAEAMRDAAVLLERASANAARLIEMRR